MDGSPASLHDSSRFHALVSPVFREPGRAPFPSLLEQRLRAAGGQGGSARRATWSGTHLSKGLGFGKEDRDENVRRIGFVCELLSRATA